MKEPTAHARPGPLAVQARAEFTLDMLRNLVVVFEAAAEDRSVLVEMRASPVHWSDGRATAAGCLIRLLFVRMRERLCIPVIDPRSHCRRDRDDATPLGTGAG